MNQANKTYLSPQLRIDGSIECVHDIEVKGEVYGSITSQNDIHIDGLVEGELIGKNISIKNEFIHCNISASGNVVIAKQTDFKGNIEANNIVVDGYVIGDLSSAEGVAVGSDAMIKGNINASSLEIEEGAKISGVVNILRG